MWVRGTNNAAVHTMPVMQRETAQAASPESCDRMAGHGSPGREGRGGRISFGFPSVTVQRQRCQEEDQEGGLLLAGSGVYDFAEVTGTQRHKVGIETFGSS